MGQKVKEKKNIYIEFIIRFLGCFPGIQWTNCEIFENQFCLQRQINVGNVLRSWILSWYSKIPSTVQIKLYEENKLATKSTSIDNTHKLTRFYRQAPSQLQLFRQGLGFGEAVPDPDPGGHWRCFGSYATTESGQKLWDVVDSIVPSD